MDLDKLRKFIIRQLQHCVKSKAVLNDDYEEAYEDFLTSEMEELFSVLELFAV